MEQLLAIDSPETFIQHMTTLFATQRATRAKDRTAASPAISDQGMQSSKGDTTVSFDSGHRLEESPDTVDTDQGVKKRQRTCKVCAIYKTKPRKFTKYFCHDCSDGNRRYATAGSYRLRTIRLTHCSYQQVHVQRST
ncbi:unnamed protein product [Phytophthora fragariaefolia]|uniref:Unnamed protein product n=1 Tax=Phytophthora fragariaefolia TaxID=1490495 RepID=A0A9W7D3J2_9STRA|nr:unnamed protein product [Phytophthora fragariaefolia]